MRNRIQNCHGIAVRFAQLQRGPKEIEELIGLLEKHRALGTLSDATPDERKDAFAARYGRQLGREIY